MSDSPNYVYLNGQKIEAVDNNGDSTKLLCTATPKRLRDNLGRLKVSVHQNIYEADFEYGAQPLRWESFTTGTGSITPLPGAGGVRMRISAVNDVTIRQSRPYHRCQPGKTMYMATAINFGVATVGQVQRVGFLDDSNGVFFEQANPTTVPVNPAGLFCVIRSDTSGSVVDTRIGFDSWSDPDGVKKLLDWTKLQMIWIEYAWYGGGALRWGVFLNGEPFILHESAPANNLSVPWSRTGNLPVRYEQRNITATTQNDMIHYGVSVIVEGRVDEQRGFTYGYGQAAGTPQRSISAGTTRFPLLTFRFRPMGTLEYGVDANYSGANGSLPAGGAAITGTPTTTSMTVTGTPWAVNQWKGRFVFFRGTGTSGLGQIARITDNTNNTLTYADGVTGLPIATAPIAGAPYIIGLVNRGQLLPRLLAVSSNRSVTLELITSTFSNPVTLTGASFNTLFSLGSSNSFAERDVSATAISTGGEVVYNSPCPSGALQTFDLSDFFALYNNIRGNAPDTLTVAISTDATSASVGASIICQEAMS
jgi:hypothetical protein